LVFESGTGQTPFNACDRMSLYRTHFSPHGVQGAAPARPGWGRFHLTRVASVILATSTRFPVLATISFALFAELVLVETGLPQFAAHVSPNGSLAGLPVSAAVSFALLPQPVFVFAGAPQFFALPTTSAAPIVYADAPRSNLDRLGKGRDRNHHHGRCCGDGECKLAPSLKHYYSSQLKAGESRRCRMPARSDSFLTFIFAGGPQANAQHGATRDTIPRKASPSSMNWDR
jgi:hypothetical protein